MRSPQILAVVALLSAGVLEASTARADMVLLLPAKGQVPGSMLSSILESETKYGVIEAGHKLIEQEDAAAALRQVEDGNPDNADEYGLLARVTKANWVVAPTVFPQDRGYRLELIAYQAQGGRTETVARDIDTDQVHKQVVEMLKVLLRPQGVGTDALPWEMPLAPVSQPSKEKKTEAPKPGGSPQTESRKAFYAGLGAGVSDSIARPKDATGNATSVTLVARVGYALTDNVAVSLSFSDNLTGPGAMAFDVSGRYLFPIAGTKLRIGPEIGPGLFLARSGSEANSFMIRGTAVAALALAPSVAVEAHVGDLRYVAASSGGLGLAGGSLLGVLKF